VMMPATGTLIALGVAGLGGIGCYVATVYVVDRALFVKITDLVRSVAG